MSGRISPRGGATLSGASAEIRAPPAGRVSVERFVVQGDNPLSEKETAATLAPFLGASADLDRLQAATGALEAVLREKGFAFYRVSLPPQMLEAGAVRLEIHAIPVASIAVQGNKHFSEANIRASLPMLKEGANKGVRNHLLTRRPRSRNVGRPWDDLCATPPAGWCFMY